MLDLCIDTDHFDQRKQTIFGHTLTVAYTIPRLCNRQYLTGINIRHQNYRSDLNSARSYSLLQKWTILHVSGVDIFPCLY